eukprot:4248409-Heterocapsa_arctica.AAC.1
MTMLQGGRIGVLPSVALAISMVATFLPRMKSTYRSKLSRMRPSSHDRLVNFAAMNSQRWASMRIRRRNCSDVVGM